MALSELSKQRYERLAQAIESNPSLYDQKQYAAASDPCNSPCCLAGWAVYLSSVTLFARLAKRPCDSDSWIAGAQKYLRDTTPETMFYTSPVTFWPEPFASRYYDASDDKTRAQVAASMLRAYISSNGTLFDEVANA